MFSGNDSREFHFKKMNIGKAYDVNVTDCSAFEFDMNYKRLELQSLMESQIKYTLITDVKLHTCSPDIIQHCPYNSTFCSRTFNYSSSYNHFKIG